MEIRLYSVVFSMVILSSFWLKLFETTTFRAKAFRLNFYHNRLESSFIEAKKEFEQNLLIIDISFLSFLFQRTSK